MDIVDEDILLHVGDRIGAWLCVSIVLSGLMVALSIIVTH